MGRTACTEPQFLYKGALYLTVELYFYSPYGPYGLYRASVPVQGCTLPYLLLSLFLGQTSAESETKSSDIDGVIKRCLVTVTVCYSTALSIMNLI